MRIAVTGSSGRIGRYVAQELDNAGHQVVGLDVQHDTQAKGGQLLVDLTDAGQVYGALAGCEAVVHMGAWANPGVVPDTRTYADNVTGTFNLLQAAADLGIRRVVSASSNQVYGFFEAPPLYAPVDEEHPCRPVNCYTLSKTAGEQAAEYFSRHKGLDILSLRILGTRTPDEIPGDIAKIVADPASAAKLLWTRYRRARRGSGLPFGGRGRRGGIRSLQYRRAACGIGYPDAGTGRALFWRSHRIARRFAGFRVAIELC